MVPNPTPFPLSSVWVLMRERMLSLSAVNILCFLFESKHMIEETSPMRQSDDCFYGSIACNNMNFNPCSKGQQRGRRAGREGMKGVQEFGDANDRLESKMSFPLLLSNILLRVSAYCCSISFSITSDLRMRIILLLFFFSFLHKVSMSLFEGQEPLLPSKS